MTRIAVDIEAALRDARPEARPAFVRAVAARLRPVGTRPGARRPALAVAATVATLVLFAALGGVVSASAAAKSAAATVAKIVSVATGKDDGNGGGGNGSPGEKSPGESQYGKKSTICHRTGSSSNPWVMITVSNSALPAHFGHGDFLAPPQGCPKKSK